MKEPLALSKSLNGLIRKFAAFSIIGVVVTLFSAILLFLSLSVLKLNIYLSYIAVYFISIGLSYILNGNIVFKSGFGIKTYLSYYAVYISGMCLGLLVISVIRHFADLDEFVNSILATPFTVLWNFILSNRIFSKQTIGQ